MTPSASLPAGAAALRGRLEAMAEPAYRAFSERLQPGARRPLLGVRVPLLRRMAADAVRAGVWREWLDRPLPPDETFEEALLRGLLVGLAPLPLDEALRRLAAYVPGIDNWALCDITCSAFRWGKKAPDEVWAFIGPYFAGSAEYDQRFAAVMSLSHFVNDAWLHRTLAALTAVRPTAYYARMGVAWALSVCMVKYPEATLHHLRSVPVPDAETYRMALQKCLESRRLPGAFRPVIEALRRGQAAPLRESSYP